jgi:cytochrome c556
MKRTLALTAAVVLVGLGAAHAQAPDPIKLRQTIFDLNGGSFAFLKSVAATKGDLKAAEPVARGIARWAALIPAMFPPGSDKGDTKALPEIWSDSAGFQKDAASFGDAATKVADAAKAGDADAFAANVKSLGDACGACHKAYRAK